MSGGLDKQVPATTGNRVQQIRTLGANKSYHMQVGCCSSLLC